MKLPPYTYDKDGETRILFFIAYLTGIFELSPEEERERAEEERAEHGRRPATARKVRQVLGDSREGEPEFKMNSEESRLVSDLLARAQEDEKLAPEDRSEKRSQEVARLQQADPKVKAAVDDFNAMSPEQKTKLAAAAASLAGPRVSSPSQETRPTSGAQLSARGRALGG